MSFPGLSSKDHLVCYTTSKDEMLDSTSPNIFGMILTCTVRALYKNVVSAMLLLLCASWSTALAQSTLLEQDSDHSGFESSQRMRDLSQDFLFVENRGQLQSYFAVEDHRLDQIDYYCNAFDGSAYFGKEGIAFGFMKSEGDEIRSTGYHIEFEGASQEVTLRGENKLQARLNIIGKSTSKELTDIVSYGGVRYEQLYDGIDLTYYMSEGSLKYDFILDPFADVSQINLSYHDILTVDVANSGDLEISTIWGMMRDSKPYSYQVIDGVEKPVAVNFVKNGDAKIGFEIEGEYDPSFELVIDPPTVQWSTYMTNAGADNGYIMDMAVGDDGSIYSTGWSNGLMPSTTTIGTTVRADDIFVYKLSADGTNLDYATIVMGSAGTPGADPNTGEVGTGIEVNAAGEAYVGGLTSSADFPVTDASTASGNRDIFLFKLNAAGTALIYSTLYGGAANDACYDIAMFNDEVYLTGYTYSSGLATAGVYDNTYDGANEDAFVLKYDAAGVIDFFTYYGGPAHDWCKGIAVGPTGDPYIHGSTASDVDIATVGAYNTGPHTGGQSTFIAHLSADGTTRNYGTYYNGCCSMWSGGIDVNSLGEAIITGGTETGIPAVNAYQATGGAGRWAYVAGVNATGTGLIFSTYLGSTTGTDAGKGAAGGGVHPTQYWRPSSVDVNDSTFLVTFETSSTGLTVQDPASFATANPNDGDGNYNGTTLQQYDAFVGLFDYSPAYTATNITMELGTYLGGSTAGGGSGRDYPTGGVNFVADDCGYCFAVGIASHSADFPTTAGTYQFNSTSGNDQATVTLFCDREPVDATVTPTDPSCSNDDGELEISNLELNFTYSIYYTDDAVLIGPLSLTSDGSGEITISNLDAGTYTDVIVAKSPTCADTVPGPFVLTAPPGVTFTVTPSDPTCALNDGSLVISGLTAGSTYGITYEDPAVVGPTNYVAAVGGTITLLSLGAGTYTDIVVDSAGCSITDPGPYTLTDPTDPTFTVTPTDPSCALNDGSLVISGLTAGTTYGITYEDPAVVGPTNYVAAVGGTITIPSLGAGTYTDLVVDSAGCSTTDAGPYTLTDPTDPTFTVTPTDPSCALNDGSLVISGLTAGTTYGITYEDPVVVGPTNYVAAVGGTITLPSLGEGTYTDVVVDSAGCSTTDTGPYTLTDPTDPTFTVTPTDPSCALNDGSLVISGLTAGTTYGITYEDPAVVGPTNYVAAVGGTITIPSLGSGTYTDLVVDSAGCSTTDAGPYTLTDPTDPTFTVTPTDPTCALNDGSLVISGLTAGTTYGITYEDPAVVGPTNFVAAVGGTITLPSLGGGTYTDVVVDSAGCSTTDAGPYTLTDPTDPTFTVTPTDPTCALNDGSLLISGLTAGTTYGMTYEDPAVVGPTNYVAAVGGTITIPSLGGGSYTDVVVDSAGCSSTDAGPYTLTDPTDPTFVVTPTDPSCALNDGSLLISGLTAGTTYGITFEDPAVVGPSNYVADVGGTITLSPLSAGTYVNIEVDSAGCSSTDAGPYTLTDPADPVFVVNPTDPSCALGDGSILLTGLSASTSYSLTYTSPGPIVVGPSVINTNGAGQFNIPALSAGDYINITLDSANCSRTDLGTYSLVDPISPVITVTPTDPSMCGGSDGRFLIQGLTALENYTLIYTNQVPAIVGPSPVNADASGSVLVSGLVEGAFTGIQIDSAGCTSNIENTNLSDPTAPVITVTPTDPTSCGGTDGILVIEGLITDSSYNVSYLEDGTPVSLANEVALTPGAITINNLLAAAYSDIQVEYKSCLSNLVAVTLSDPVGPTITSTKSDPSTCGGSDGSFTVEGLVTGTVYDVFYDDDGTPFSLLAVAAVAPGEISVTGLDAGSYTNIIVTLAGCPSNVESESLNDPGSPSIISTSVDPSACGATDASITISGLITGTTYTLNYLDGATPVSLLNQVAVAPGELTISGLGQGTYSGINVELSGCTSNSETENLSDPSPPVIATTFTDPTTCAGLDGEIVISGLTAGANYNLTYEDPSVVGPTVITADVSGEFTITGLGEGTYSNIVVDSASCTSNAETETLTDPLPVVITAVGNDPTLCGASNGSININGAVPNGAYVVDYLDDGLSVTGTFVANALGVIVILNLNAGSYTDISIAQLNCISNLVDVNLSDPNSPVITVVGADPSTCGVNSGSILISGLTAATPYDVFWTVGGLADSSIATISDLAGEILMVGLSAGNYTDVFVRLAGCESNRESVILVDPPSPIIAAVATNPDACGASTGSILISGMLVSTSYDLYWTANGTADSLIGTTSDASGNIEILNLPSGSYTDIFVRSTSCESNHESVSLSDPGTPVISVVGTDPDACGALTGSLLISGMNALANYDVFWTFNGTADSSIATLSDASGEIELASLLSGNYTDIYVRSAGCESNREAVVLSDPAAPIISVVGDDPTCNGGDGSIVISGLMVSTNYLVSYVYQSAPVNLGTIQSDAVGEITIAALDTGSYSGIFVTLTNCESNIESVVLSPPNCEVLATVSTDPSTCGGNEGTITLSGLVAGLQYDVDYLDDGLPVQLLAMTADASGEILITGLDAGNYTDIFVTRGAFVSNTSSEILVDPVSPVIITDATDVTDCGVVDGAITILALVPGSFYDVDYLQDGTPVNLPDQASDVNGEIILNGLDAGNYTSIRVTRDNCPSNVDAQVITAPVAVTITAVPTDVTTCGGLDGTILISGLSPNELFVINYELLGNPVSQSLNADASGEILISGLPEGNYSNITAAQGACVSNAESAVISGPQAPVISSSSTPVTTCGGTEGAVVIAGLTAGETYQLGFDKDGVAQPSISVIASATGEVNLIGLSAGLYVFEITSSDGCVSNPVSEALTDPVSPSFVVVTTNETCEEEDGTLQIEGLEVESFYTISYLDNRNNTIGPFVSETDALGSILLEDLEEGQYSSVSVTDDNLCQSIDVGPHDIDEAEGPCELFIPTAISPNDDNDNETWEVKGLGFYENPIVRVYNRYGNLVWEHIGEYIPWDGTRLGEMMPVATYYYVILPEGELGPKYTGPLTILR